MPAQLPRVKNRGQVANLDRLAAAVSSGAGKSGSRANVPEKECAQPVYEYIAAMPTYIYETTDPAKPVRTFEVKQSVHDEPLRSDPETGEGARRVISAGYSVLVRGKSVGPSVGSVGSH